MARNLKNITVIIRRRIYGISYCHVNVDSVCLLLYVQVVWPIVCWRVSKLEGALSGYSRPAVVHIAPMSASVSTSDAKPPGSLVPLCL